MVKITAFIFAAGLGTRLYPLTAHKPKALVCYEGEPLLKRAIDNIIATGIHDIIVNVHHFPDQITDYLRTNHFDARIRISDERAYLRDTAGGLKFAEPFFGQSDILLLYNVDIISSINLTTMIETHLRTKAEVTLSVKARKSSRYLIFNQSDMRLCGWHNAATGERMDSMLADTPIELAFSGIHVIDRSVVDRIPSVEKLSLTPFYIQSASALQIIGYQHDQDTWMDVGDYGKFSKSLT